MAFSDYKPAWAVKDLTAAQRYVLLALAEHRNGETDLCCPSYTTLVKETGLGIGTVCRSIKKLGEQGTIAIHNDRKFRSNNRYTFSWNPSTREETLPPGKGDFHHGRDSSTTEETLPPGICNKEVNREVEPGKKQGTQQPVVPTGSAVVPEAPSKPEDREALRLACLFWDVLKKAGNLQPEKSPRRWAKPFSELLPEWGEALESNILFIQLCPRWAERFRDAKHPVAYLGKTLEHIEGDRIRYEAKRDSSRPPASAPPPLEDDLPTLSDDVVIDEHAEDAENPEVITDFEVEELE